ncbi:dTDP-4-dehydrorhamnose 3,5-epimerase [Caldibacillus thermoamylovorans]|jgi:dTDP-4-dehydrorhamnose 3,5-epimerase|uniref:dTDP-4-dehydrorhamnose 3,5-epimerase n=1 Tax=Bacillaceae TaxID=186817 RepID=UPI0005A45DBC|nr:MULTISPECIES: dTDP-4-dehydrorhamnose 3,5-epimerase [Bacillaceae]MCB5935982.1 dTDP-4-dehydrorhamnose 3,5-epimerase [Bacillus sp. DFI.2.34]AWI13844.1 dTDP-4-dehydrorhamnose 3,5-epimerase [Caldibacillus thermoamylovorans]KIO66308.1 dTDP-4-dehydrorhamnose 3,5-epimerase [Caldibacillus thermoamylovorans]MCB7070326.1 dTDP-4-dehydrorhamnose 3,5-epimerase [Caldibacillus sp. 210928-DFI.2.22]MCB7073870.1 dTDP-4-dehydrorhamnose 3,5-epimerase [Caldibacillus sp. 210928-DFI.2.18]
MNIIDTSIPDVKILEPKVFGDHRGYFMESYNKKLFAELGLDYHFVQDNQSLSREVGVIRGLHFQLNPKAQLKLVRAVRGAIYDVVVDIRKGSPTYGKWTGVILSEYNNRQLLVPKGFAHGFCTLVPDCIVAYKVDEFYSPEHDGGILWNDPALGIDWPTSAPILSDKDTKHPTLAEADLNFVYEK